MGEHGGPQHHLLLRHQQHHRRRQQVADGLHRGHTAQTGQVRGPVGAQACKGGAAGAETLAVAAACSGRVPQSSAVIASYNGSMLVACLA